MSTINLNKIYDFRKLNWDNSNLGSSDGILPKAVIEKNNHKYYLKLGSYSKPFGIYGIEPIIEIINSRIGQILGLPVLDYNLKRCLVNLKGDEISTIVSISNDYAANCKQTSFEKVYETMCEPQESTIDFCKRIGIIDSIYKEFLFDFIICNLDRHGKNTEILTNKFGKMNIAPFFDNSLTFISNRTDTDIKENKMYNDEMRVNNYIGTQNLKSNLFLIDKPIKIRVPRKEDRELLFQGLGKITTREFRDYVWNIFLRRVYDARHCGISFIQWC